MLNPTPMPLVGESATVSMTLTKLKAVSSMMTVLTHEIQTDMMLRMMPIFKHTVWSRWTGVGLKLKIERIY
jgi:hypothetical protein